MTPAPVQSPDLIVVGSYNLDIGIRVPRFPLPGETLAALDLVQSDGGKGSNQAVQAARLGTRVGMIAAVGDDAAGQAARQLWNREAIDTTRVVVHDATPTGTAFITVNAAGENQIVIVAGANAALLPGYLSDAQTMLRSARLVLAQLEVPLVTLVSAFGTARDAGAITVLNAAPVIESSLTELLALTDFLIVNESEAHALVAQLCTGSEPLANAALPDGVTDDPHDPIATGYALAAVLVESVDRGVIITLGAQGAILLLADQSLVHLPAPATEVVDTTGAGDAFAGAFAADLIRHGRPADALELGVRAGSHACRGRGAMPSLGRRDDLDHAGK